MIYTTPLASTSLSRLFCRLVASNPGPGHCTYATEDKEAQWFYAYWNALLPYVETAQEYHVEQFAIGTEEAWLEKHAPSSLWDMLIAQFHQILTGKLTYDRNWASLGDTRQRGCTMRTSV